MSETFLLISRLPIKTVTVWPPTSNLTKHLPKMLILIWRRSWWDEDELLGCVIAWNLTHGHTSFDLAAKRKSCADGRTRHERWLIGTDNEKESQGIRSSTRKNPLDIKWEKLLIFRFKEGQPRKSAFKTRVSSADRTPLQNALLTF